MNRPRWQKILSDLWGNRTRSVLVVSSIAVGLFAIGVIATIYVVIAEDMRASYRAVNPANIFLQTDLFDPAVLDHLKRIDGVRQVEGVRTVDLRVLNRRGEWESIVFKAAEETTAPVINRPILKEGRWPPADGEIVISQHKQAALGAQVGDSLWIELPSGKPRAFRLVGVVQDLTIGAYSGGGGFFHAPAQAYITQNTLEQLEQEQTDLFSGLYATVDGDGNSVERIQAVAARLSQELEDDGIEVRSSTTRSSQEHPNGYLVNAIVGVLFVLGLLIVFLSGFLITNTLQSLLNQQVQQIGIMKTVGARRGQIASVYMLLILVFGLAAFLIAMPLADMVSFALLEFLSRELNFVLQGRRLILPVVGMQAALALLMPQLAALLPILRGTRISVQEALSGISQGKGDEKTAGRKGWLHHLGQSRRFPRPLLIAIRNTFRRRGRLLLTLTTLTLGGAVFIATFNVQVSMGKYIDQIGQYFLADVNLSLDRPYRLEEIERMLADVPGIGRVEGWATGRSEMILADGSSGQDVALLAPPVNSPLVRPVLLQGRWIEPGDRNAIVLNELFLSTYPELKLGGPLRLKVNGKELDWVIVGFFQFAGKNGGLTAYTSYDYLAEAIGQPFKAATFRVVGSRPGLSAAEQDRLAQTIEARLKAAGVRISDLTTGSFLTGIAGGGFATLTAFLLFLAILTAIVGSIGLAGTMSMNVMERTREIGVMRAIGASDRTLMRMVLVEGIIIGLLSYLLGALLAFPISKVMADGISYAVFDAPSNFGFTPVGFVIWLGVVVVLSFLASVMPARSAARLTIREVLAYE